MFQADASAACDRLIGRIGLSLSWQTESYPEIPQFLIPRPLREVAEHGSMESALCSPLQTVKKKHSVGSLGAFLKESRALRDPGQV